jgi:hypothetical protein
MTFIGFYPLPTNTVNVPIDPKLPPFDLERDSLFFDKFQRLAHSIYYSSLKGGAFTKLKAAPQ